MSSVRICSSRTTESLGRPQLWEARVMWVGRRAFPVWDVIAAAITSQVNKAKMPTHIELGAPHFGLTRDSVVLTEQIRTIDKKRLREKMGCLDENAMRSVDEALAVSFGLQG